MKSLESLVAVRVIVPAGAEVALSVIPIVAIPMSAPGDIAMPSSTILPLISIASGPVSHSDAVMEVSTANAGDNMNADTVPAQRASVALREIFIDLSFKMFRALHSDASY